MCDDGKITIMSQHIKMYNVFKQHGPNSKLEIGAGFYCILSNKLIFTETESETCRIRVNIVCMVK